MKEKTLVIGTRGSQLALWQANWVRDTLLGRYPDMKVELSRIKTSGDKITDVPLAQVGGKGLFVKEIEEALLREDIDLAVHSMKDVPTELPDGLHIAVTSKREDPRDAFISKNNINLKDLPNGATIGTSSLRRQAQLLSFRPDIKIKMLRGNLDTRIRKLTEGEDFDAIILASAGIKRLGWAQKITETIEPELLLPAIGQGAIGIETRKDDERTNQLISFLNHTETSVAVKAERAFLKVLEGGCQVPIACYGTIENNELTVKGLVGKVDGSKIIKDSVKGSLEDCEALGIELAKRLLNMGAKPILDEVYGTEVR